MAQRSLQHNADRATARRLQHNSHFQFQDIPLDVASQILVLATATSAYWGTYKSLIKVSRAMQALVYDACFPYLPIMLHTKQHVDSFCLLLASHTTLIGPRIRSLWFIAGVKADVERTTGLDILKKCTGITHLACRINLLSALVSESQALVHHGLRHLTLIEAIVPWKLLLSQPAACQLFMQLTHLRVSGGSQFVKPDFCFASLSHLSFACHDLSTCVTPKPTPTSPFPPAQFPALVQIVPSIPYMYWRLKNPEALHTSGVAIDGRIHALACPKKWKEADIWESARRGGKDLWGRARTGEYLQKSRAFTLEPRTTGRGRRARRSDWDDWGWDSDEYGPFGGETGL